MGWRTITAAVVLICAATFFVLITCFAYRRPLFHDRYVSEHSYNIFPTWTPTYAVADKAGAIGFVDTGVNMFVVVVSDEKSIWTHWTQIDASPSEAVLLVGTPYEVRVQARPNTLMIINNGACLSLPIERGTAQDWQRDILALTSDRGWTLLGEIARRYHGDGKAAIEQMGMRAGERGSNKP